MQATRVVFGVWDDARRAAFLTLDGTEPRMRGRLASRVADSLRDAGLLAHAVEQHYSAVQFASLLGRSDEHIMQLIRVRKLAPVMRDGRSWLIPASTCQRYLDEHTFGESSRIPEYEAGEAQFTCHHSSIKDLPAIKDIWADARRAVFIALEGFEPRMRSKMAAAVTERLREAGLLAQAVEQHYSAVQLGVLLGRSDEHVMQLIRRGELAPVSRDGRGWLIPASTALRYLSEHTFGESSKISGIETGAKGEKIITKAGEADVRQPGTGACERAHLTTGKEQTVKRTE